MEATSRFQYLNDISPFILWYIQLYTTICQYLSIFLQHSTIPCWFPSKSFCVFFSSFTIEQPLLLLTTSLKLSVSLVMLYPSLSPIHIFAAIFFIYICVSSSVSFDPHSPNHPFYFSHYCNSTCFCSNVIFIPLFSGVLISI